MRHSSAPSRPAPLGRLGRACYRHRYLTVISWVAGLACLVVLWMNFGAPANNNFTTSDPGQAILNQHFARQSGDVLTLAVRSSAPVTSPAVRSRVGQALAPMREAAHVTSVTGPYSAPGRISRDGHIAFATVQFGVPGTSIPASEAKSLMNDAKAASGHGVTFSLGGDVVDQAETPYGGSSDTVGIIAAAIVLLIAFGSLLAMGLPLVTAIFGIGSGLALTALLGHVFPAPSFAPIIASMIGLGVGVDYALFIVTRFREALLGTAGGRHPGPAPREALRGAPDHGVPGAPGETLCPPGQAPGEALRPGATAEDAAVTAMSTAGRSVLIAGGTVVIGILGLFVLRQPLMNGIAVSGATAVGMTVIGSLTLLPALLGFSGTRLARPSRFRLPGRPRRAVPYSDARVARQRLDGSVRAGSTGRSDGPTPRGRWAGRRTPLPRIRSAENPAPHVAQRWAAVVQRRPVIFAAASAALILVLAVPALSMKLSMPDESAQAGGTMGRASYQTMAQGFGPGFDAPLIVAATLPAGATGHASSGTARTGAGNSATDSGTRPAGTPGAGTAAAGTAAAGTAGITALATAIGRTPGVAQVTPPVISRDGRAVMLVAYPATGEQDAATNALVNRIDATVLPRAAAPTGIRAYLTGPNAGNVAFADIVGQRLPWLIAIVVALSMVLLLLMFRSVSIAVKAAVMNLLSVLAAYGVLTAITQWGWLRQAFGFPEAMTVTTWVPMFLFVILFGLSMDYEVFLLSRIKESYDATGDNSASVGHGLAGTARVISAAAIIMVAVFGSFVAGPEVSVKQIGLGLAVAVLIDATVVRLVLVPAIMELLGRANWWLPAPLARVLPGAPTTPSAAPMDSPATMDSTVPADSAVPADGSATSADRHHRALHVNK